MSLLISPVASILSTIGLLICAVSYIGMYRARAWGRRRLWLVFAGGTVLLVLFRIMRWIVLGYP
jgi:hypothetical protein